MYAWRLADAPIYLSHDEVLFALHAQAIATTGHDLNGRLLPLYFQITANYWAQPLLVYATAASLAVLPLTEWSIRAPSVLVGVAAIVLMYFVAARFERSPVRGAIAATMLAMTPAHVIHSRMGVDPIYAVLFVVIWLLWVARFEQQGRLAALWAATTTLGVGIYSYIASIVVMPLLFLITCLFAVPSRGVSLRRYAAAAAGFLVPFSLLAAWLTLHPSAYAAQVARYNLYDASRFGPLQGVKEILSHVGLSARLSVYWDYFNPSFLFLAGGSSLTNSTRQAGVFLVPIALLLPVGIYAALQPPRSWANLLLIAGLAAAPVAAALVLGAYAVDRVLVMVPFVILLATRGVGYLWKTSPRAGRAIVCVALLAMPLQFARFYGDYFGDYRIRSSTWFERNIRGALTNIEERDAHEPRPAVYLPTSIPWIDAYWKFYLLKDHRTYLTERTRYFDPKTLNVDEVPARSLVLVELSEAGLAQMNPGLAVLRPIDRIAEPNGVPSFIVLER